MHIQPRPGTDAALALGLMRAIVDEALFDPDYVEQYALGFAELCEPLTEYLLGRVADITGIAAAEIARLARGYAAIGPAAIRLLVGMEHRIHGAMAYRTIACLPALTGARRERGGGLLYVTSWLAFAALNPGLLAPLPDTPLPLRTVNMVQLGRALTDPAMEPPIQALLVWNATPMATTPNQVLIRQGLLRDDLLTVVSEQFKTDTARYADYVLPATTQVAQLDLMWSWGHEYLALNQPAIAPRGKAIPNTELFRRLARGMGFTDPIFTLSDEAMLRVALTSDHPYLAGITSELLARGGRARLWLPADWRPFAEGNFPTPLGKCEFWSASLDEGGFDPLPAYQPPRATAAADDCYPLSLTTAKGALHFLNSSYANLPRQLGAKREPRLDLHPSDAAPPQIADGDLVRIFNDQGEVQARARVGHGVPAGAVTLPSGWWPSLSPGGAGANLLTLDDLSDWGEGGNFHDAFVEVAPEVTIPAVDSGAAAIAKR